MTEEIAIVDRVQVDIGELGQFRPPCSHSRLRTPRAPLTSLLSVVGLLVILSLRARRRAFAFESERCFVD